mmetsp:Transcript_15104/g.33213  ORF Transcript_15104/g.33213 Transcript_15104/m.33213 type:complete len:241 (-) Transcript_15104:121-843(-)
MRCPRRMATRGRSPLAQDLLAVLLDTAGNEGCCLRLREDDFHVRPCLLDDPPGALKGTSCAIAGDPVVEPAALKVGQDLRPCSLGVVLRIRLVLKLPREEPAVLLGELLGFHHHPDTSLRCRSQDNLGTEHAHDLSTLDGEGLCHGSDELVSSLGANHRQGNAGIAARRLHHGAPRLELSTALGGLNQGLGQAILDGAQGVEELALHVKFHASRRQAVHLHNGGVADRLCDVLVDSTARC